MENENTVDAVDLESMSLEELEAQIQSEQPTADDAPQQDVAQDETTEPEQAEATPEQEPQAEYRSQKDVDRAFGKRLAAERAKWEREQEEQNALRQRQQQAMQEAGLTDEQREAIAPLLGASPAVSPEQRFLGQIQARWEEIRDDHPDYAEMDLLNEIANNRLFGAALVQGVPLEDALAAVDVQGRLERAQAAGYEEGRKKAAEDIRHNNARPAPSVSVPHKEIDVNDLSDDDIDKIAERVRRGERVVL